MDNLVYVALSGIRQAEQLQTVVSHNLANVSTVGFRSELPVYESADILGDGLASRANAIEVAQDWNDATGSLIGSQCKTQTATKRIRAPGVFA
jgi:flagellar basal-body rod protein FlgF